MKRRHFLIATATASGALLIRLAHAQESLPYLGAREEPSSVGPYIRIEKNGTVIIGTRSVEVGQGVKTSLSMLIAEELDVDWNRVRVEQLPYRYDESDKNSSDSGDGIPVAWTELREAGAAARAMLVQAAANQWNLLGEHVAHPIGECRCAGRTTRNVRCAGCRGERGGGAD